ncbi:MAG: helix-turn-helix transcriptional regulator [Desulfobacteraceae bacterium]|jgi:transcriptional regulator with XRE-family HTH domain
MSRKKIDISQINMDKIGGRFTYVRLFYGQNQGEFAKNIGLSVSNVSNIENHKYEPSFEPLRKLIEIYKVNPIWLLSGEDEPYKVVMLKNERLFLKYDDTPVKEYSEDFAMHLEAVYGENDPGNPKNEGDTETTYNIDTLNETPDGSFGKDVECLREIYNYGDYGIISAIHQNLKTLSRTVQREKMIETQNIEIHKLKSENAEILKRLEQLEQKLSANGREKDYKPAKAAGC